MYRIVVVLLFLAQGVSAQKLSKSDNALVG